MDRFNKFMNVFYNSNYNFRDVLMSKSKLKNNMNLMYLLAIVPSVGLLYLFIVLQNLIPHGYEIDIYAQLPSYFWIILIFNYFCSCILLLQKNRFLKNAGIYYFLANFLAVFLIIPELGYYVYGSDDEISHIGNIRNILSAGFIDTQNIYPSTHILYSIISKITGLEPNYTCFVLSAYFSLLFIIGIITLSRKILNFGSSVHYILIPSAFIFYLGHFHFSNVPNYISFTLLPIILFSMFFYLTKKTYQTTILLIIFLLSLPFLHPFIWLFIVFLICCVFIYANIYSHPTINVQSLFLLCICSFGMWAINGYILDIFGKNISLFAMGSIDSVGVEAAAKFSKINLNWYELFEFLLFYSGRYSIPLLIISIFVLAVLSKKYVFSSQQFTQIKYLIITLIIFSTFQLFFVFNPVISHSPDRISNLNYAVFVLVPLFAISLNYLCKYNSHWKYILKITFILTFVFSLSVYGAFYSPLIKHANIATTNNEVEGMAWLFESKNEYPIYDISGSIGMRYSTLFNSPAEHRNRLGKDILWSSIGNVPDHFGYDKYHDYTGDEQYIVINTRTELLYQTVYKEVGRFNENDFIKFDNDSNISKVYDSLNIKHYMS